MKFTVLTRITYGKKEWILRVHDEINFDNTWVLTEWKKKPSKEDITHCINSAYRGMIFFKRTIRLPDPDSSYKIDYGESK